MIEIVRIQDRPEHASTVAGWVYRHWPYEFAGVPFEDWLEELHDTSARTVFVALEDGVPVGTASLDAADLPARADLTPWLASVYVLPEHRSKGIGSRLIERVEAEAWARGVPVLHLQTPEHEAYYAARGWRTLERLSAWDHRVAVMSKRGPAHAAH